MIIPPHIDYMPLQIDPSTFFLSQVISRMEIEHFVFWHSSIFQILISCCFSSNSCLLISKKASMLYVYLSLYNSLAHVYSLTINLANVSSLKNPELVDQTTPFFFCAFTLSAHWTSNILHFLFLVVSSLRIPIKTTMHRLQRVERTRAQRLVSLALFMFHFFKVWNFHVFPSRTFFKFSTTMQKCK